MKDLLEYEEFGFLVQGLGTVMAGLLIVGVLCSPLLFLCVALLALACAGGGC